MDRPSTALGFFAVESFEASLGEDTTQRVRAFARAERVSTFVTLVAGLLMCVHRMSRNDDVVLGSSEVNRDTGDLFGVVGMLARPAFVRSRIDASTRFVDVVRAVELNLGEAREVSLDFIDALAELMPGRDPWTDPLACLTFAYVTPTEGASALTLEGLELEYVPVHRQDYQPDAFGLMLMDHGDDIRLVVNFDAEHLSERSARDFASHYAGFLRRLVLSATDPVAAIPLVDADEPGGDSIWARRDTRGVAGT